MAMLVGARTLPPAMQVSIRQCSTAVQCTNNTSGTCDPDGCDFNSYRQGDTSFYGKGLTVDTSSKFTVVTQFIGSPLTEIKRFYVQGGKTIPNSESTIANVTGNSITTAYCDAQKAAFGDNYSFKAHGGMQGMSTAMQGGMTLGKLFHTVLNTDPLKSPPTSLYSYAETDHGLIVMSIWDDHYANMLWLDSTYPTTNTAPGGPRGTCATSSGVPADVEGQSPGASVTYSNIKFGPINSTFSAT